MSKRLSDGSARMRGRHCGKPGRAQCLAAAACSLGVALGGCGNSHSTSVGKRPTSAANSSGSSVPSVPPGFPTPKPRPTPLKVASAARMSDGAIARRYTCKGADISPPVTWSAVPANAKELVLFVHTLQSPKPVLNWAVAGLSPALRSIDAGTLPSGAIVGRNSFKQDRYSVCPAGSSGSTSVSIVVAALPRTITVSPGFGATALRGALAAPGVHEGSVLMAAGDAKAGG